MAGLYIELLGTTRQVDAADLAFIGRHLTIPDGEVLDLGCGPGHLTDYLRSRGVDATGIDMVPPFIAYSRTAYPDGRYRLGSMAGLDAESGSVAGVLAWFSLIHVPAPELDVLLAEIRRVMAPGGTLVTGIFTGDAVEEFDHKVVTAYRWPADEFSGRLARLGFTEIDREHRRAEGTNRPYAAIAAVLDAG
ncbi:class I SAM-dependent methyltransferase [Actinoplanes oblitus]